MHRRCHWLTRSIPALVAAVACGVAAPRALAEDPVPAHPVDVGAIVDSAVSAAVAPGSPAEEVATSVGAAAPTSDLPESASIPADQPTILPAVSPAAAPADPAPAPVAAPTPTAASPPPAAPAPPVIATPPAVPAVPPPAAKAP